MMNRFARVVSLLVVIAACFGAGTPVYAASPQDSTLHVAATSCRTAPMPQMAISAAPAYRVAQLTDSVKATRTLPSSSRTLVTSLVGLALIGAVKTVAADKDSRFTQDSVRQEHNKLVADFYYFLLHRPAWQVAAAAVAPPVINIGGTTSKVKTTATTQLLINGVVKSLTATDDLWTLTGGNLAIGSVRRYLLLWDGATATTVVSVLASNDQVIASYASAAAALAACRYPKLPPAGTTIVGILSITNITNAFVPGTTALTATGVTAAYLDGLDDSVFLSQQVTP